MKATAILASFNEQHYVRACLENYISQGISVYLIDNESTDGTRDIASEYLNRGLIGIETMGRNGKYEWEPILRRKEELFQEIGPDWAIHADMDEIRRSPRPDSSLLDEIVEADGAGYNLINFIVYLFVPTREEPFHAHERFHETLRTYRYIEPSYPNQIKAWKHEAGHLVDLADGGGHAARVREAKLFPRDMILRHYPVLSLEHAVEKYVCKTYDVAEVRRGWHGWKAHVSEDQLCLPSRGEMCWFEADHLLTRDRKITRNPIFIG